jgi:hypothetical protein
MPSRSRLAQQPGWHGRSRAEWQSRARRDSNPHLWFTRPLLFAKRSALNFNSTSCAHPSNRRTARVRFTASGPESSQSSARAAVPLRLNRS